MDASPTSPRPSRPRLETDPEIFLRARAAFMAADDDSEWTTAEVATVARCSVALLEKLRRNGDGPPFTTFGRRVFYTKRDVQAWMDQVRVPARSTAEAHATRRVLVRREGRTGSVEACTR